jgi:hypothetical protein
MSTHQGRLYELEDQETPRMFAPSMREAVADDPEVLGVDAAVERMEVWELEA